MFNQLPYTLSLFLNLYMLLSISTHFIECISLFLEQLLGVGSEQWISSLGRQSRHSPAVFKPFLHLRHLLLTSLNRLEVLELSHWSNREHRPKPRWPRWFPSTVSLQLPFWVWAGWEVVVETARQQEKRHCGHANVKGHSLQRLASWDTIKRCLPLALTPVW